MLIILLFLNCRLIAALDVSRLMEFLAYLGYISTSDENQLSAIIGQ